MKIQYKFSFLLALTLSFLSVTICSYGGELKKSEEKTIQQRTSEDKEETLTHEVITDEIGKILYVKYKLTGSAFPSIISSNPKTFEYQYWTKVSKIFCCDLCKIASEQEGFCEVRYEIEDARSKTMVTTAKLSDYELYISKKITKDEFEKKMKIVFK